MILVVILLSVNSCSGLALNFSFLYIHDNQFQYIEKESYLQINDERQKLMKDRKDLTIPKTHQVIFHAAYV